MLRKLRKLLVQLSSSQIAVQANGTTPSTFDLGDRRQRIRSTIVVPLLFRVMDEGIATYPGVIRDVSETGACFLSGRELQQGCHIRLAVPRRNGLDAVELLASIVYCRLQNPGYSVGCLFQHLLNHDTLSVLSGEDRSGEYPAYAPS